MDNNKDSKSPHTRSKRREKQDRDAKRQTRSARDSSDVVPGAQASREEHKSKGKSRSGRSASSRSWNRDEKSAHRNRSSATASVPSAQTGRSKSRRDEKAKERRNTRATRPGVESASFSKDRSRSKASRNAKTSDKNKEEEDIAAKGDGEPVVAALLIEEEGDDEKKAKEMAHMRKEMAAEAERQRQRLEEENRRREEAGRMEAERLEKEQKKKRRNMIICVVLVVLVLIGGGVGAFFVLNGSNDVAPENVNMAETLEPSSTPSASPSADPSGNPSTAPTQGVYKQPSLEECERIAAGLPIDGEDQMTARNFDIVMQVDLADDSDITLLVPELETKIEQRLVPNLLGCPRDAFIRRQLIGKKVNGKEPSNHRHLQSIRYAIAKAIVAVSLTDDACQDSNSSNCSILTLNLELRVRGNENAIDLAGIILEVFPNGQDIRPQLGLVAPFDTVVVQIIRSNDPTVAPTIAPTGVGSENSTSFPTATPSNNPSSAPVIGPTVSTPAPSVIPSTLPSTTPSAAPTPTPPPTVDPQLGVTLQPTRTSSSSPTTNPSETPSKSPSSIPSSTPSIDLSTTPTIDTSVAPSPGPTSGPTSGPTPNPTTSAPTSIYLGCYTDDEKRDMDILFRRNMEVQECRDSCKDIGYPFAAIQEGSICFCGNSYGSLGSGSNCNNACLNSADENCGGPFANSVYMSGANGAYSSAPVLESDLYCGCFQDITSDRDLVFFFGRDLSQIGCIRYCKSEGYDFAGLQYQNECWCGDTPAGAFGTSITCFTVDKDRDETSDICTDTGEGACYGGTNDCECGGAGSNTLFRTSQAVSCPSTISPTIEYLACGSDDALDRDLSVLGSVRASVSGCRTICSDIGFVYSGLQEGLLCFCGNSYGNYGTGGVSCNSACAVDSGESDCGGVSANSIYWSGAAVAPVAELDDNLYCGCMGDVPSQRDLKHFSPYLDLGQKACIYYCRSKNFDFAGLQFTNQCWCGNSAGLHGPSNDCNMNCQFPEASNCYDGSSSCTCGGSNANNVFRTSSSSPSCPAAGVSGS
ncbi:unnamed protein product [Cylindrotheca closterium]|uniref:WSC domain-containing protein n=1 Tax=Cylindrotheca closterium TaxID=2856 RepID=A0AAD2GD68_9STRA|nr:unnamed protein product [Cylindrotheca closterium]